MGLIDELRGKRVYFDANIFIYLIEGNAEFQTLLSEISQALADGLFEVVSSHLTLTEVLPPLVRKGDQELINKVIEFICDADTFDLREADESVCIQAAVLRAEYGIKTPDALHVATAIHENCEVFLTNDARIRAPNFLKRIILSDFRE